MGTDVAVTEGRCKPRKTWIAIISGLLLPGLGQVYNGQFRKGAVFYLLCSLGELLVFSLTFQVPFTVFAAILLIPLLIQLLAIVDAARTARRLKEQFQPRKYNRSFVYIALYLIFGLIGGQAVAMFVKHDIVQAYKIPAGSMVPTLLVGDHILVDKSPDAVARGDIVVLKFPEDKGKARQRDFIKRIIGLPGDKIEIRDKQLYVNDQITQEDYTAHEDSRILPSAASPRDNMAPTTVPEGMYFTMGDNRDYSYDSRFWGFVAEEDISGKAREIYWSWDKKNSEVRWDRLGRKIHQ